MPNTFLSFLSLKGDSFYSLSQTAEAVSFFNKIHYTKSIFNCQNPYDIEKESCQTLFCSNNSLLSFILPVNLMPGHLL